MSPLASTPNADARRLGRSTQRTRTSWSWRGARRSPSPSRPPRSPSPSPSREPEPAKYVEPEPQPAPPAPISTVLALSASPADRPGKVVLGWSAFNGDGFAYYKLVRSTDGDATWPGSGSDELVAAIGNAG